MHPAFRTVSVVCLLVSLGLLVEVAVGALAAWQAPLIALTLSVWTMILSHDYISTRWLLWNTRCLRGRRCANMVFTGPPDGSIESLDLPPGSMGQMTYQCGGCGTIYSSTVILNGETWTQTDRERVA